MSNVLPFENVVRLKRVMRAKFVLTGALIIAASAIAGLVALAPSFFVIYFPGAAIEQNAQAGVSGQDAKRREDGETTSRIRILLSELSSLTAASTPVSELVESVYQARPAGVTIGGIAYARGMPSTITIVGEARSRDDVSAFRNVLAEDKRYEKVSVPVAALVGALAGNFTITLSGQF